MSTQSKRSRELTVIRQQFTSRIHATDEDKKVWTCNHCKKDVFNWKTWSATRARKHIQLCSVARIDSGLQGQVRGESYVYKRRKRNAGLTVAAGSSLNSTTMADHRAAAYAEAASSGAGGSSSTSSSSSAAAIPTRASAATVKRGAKQHDIRSYGIALDKRSAYAYIKMEVEAICARFEPLSRLENPFVRAALFQKCPGLDRYLPEQMSTIFRKYVIPLDEVGLLLLERERKREGERERESTFGLTETTHSPCL